MRISFQIEYRTTWGENVGLRLTYYSAAGNTAHSQQELATTDGVVWKTEITPPPATTGLEYSYYIVKDGKEVRREWELLPHKTRLSADVKRMLCHDRWRAIPEDAYCHTSAFTDVFVPRRRGKLSLPPAERNILLHVFAHSLPQGCVVAVLGNQTALGDWTAGRELRLQELAPNEWAFSVDAAQITGTMEYKFLAIDEKTGEQRGWEMRNNRYLTPPHTTPGMAWTVQDEDAHFPFSPWRGAGCVIPVFSIRSEGSFGIGDFGDIKRMVDWLALTGQHVLQLLPVNDTTTSGHWRDSYPYNCISVYAFNPIYVDLRALPKLHNAAKRKRFASLQRELNALAQVDYEEVYKAKSEYLHLIFAQEGEERLKSAGFTEYFTRNEEWLVPYASFCSLRDKHGTADFRQWGDMSLYDASRISRMREEDAGFATSFSFYCYVQYLLHIQLLDASRYASSHGVALKGDIPIGICPDSVDAWAEPDYFNVGGQAGAPPDAFSPTGQNWGFPTYNWEAMMADGCRWWRRRLHKMAEYFHAFRIDHVLGFFRIWEIPRHSVHGLLGQFSPALPMTREEIEGYGLTWREEDYTKPLINDWALNKMFGDRTAEARHKYIEPNGNGSYSPRPEYSTQQRIKEAFANSHDLAMRDRLYELVSNVLFIPDSRDSSAFHPRIEAQKTYAYLCLGDREKDAFNRLYEEYFYHRHNHFWREEGIRKLRALVGATRMLPCAEDLGMVPACVPGVLDALRILSLEIQTMPKNPQYAFAHLWENPYRSVATISTHDMPTLRGWWEEDREATQRFYNETLCLDGPAPHPLPGWLAEQIVSLHLKSPSMLCLLSFQDWLSIDETLRCPNVHAERINVPANPSQYWRYRMHITTEQLMRETALNDKIRSLILAS